MSNDNRKSLDAIQALALRDIDAASDEEIRAGIQGSGRDPDAVALRVAESLDRVVAEFMRNRAAATKAVMATAARPTPKARPALEKIKELVQGAFARDPGLAAAFRDGNKQSENDLVSLYDDLLAMGKIESPEDGHRL